MPVIAGFDVPLSEGTTLELKATYNRTCSNGINATTTIDARDHDDFMIVSAGLKFRLSGAKDSDNDGVKDKEDACINTQGTEATNGCPDNDTVTDLSIRKTFAPMRQVQLRTVVAPILTEIPLQILKMHAQLLSVRLNSTAALIKMGTRFRMEKMIV